MRTKLEFNEWFKSSNGDPWGYESNVVKLRFNKSINFIKKFVDNSDLILECGCFKGQFTRILATSLPRNNIQAFDISTYAITIAKKESHYSNVTYFDADILDLDPLWCKHSNFEGQNCCVIMMEVLYYLDSDERQLCLDILANKFFNSKIIISAPVVGDKYFSEPEIKSWFKSHSFLACESVSLKRNLFFLNNFILKLSNKSTFLQNILVNQKIFIFSPILK